MITHHIQKVGDINRLNEIEETYTKEQSKILLINKYNRKLMQVKYIMQKQWYILHIKDEFKKFKSNFKSTKATFPVKKTSVKSIKD